MSASRKSQIDAYVIERVREKREQNKLSQSELATHLNVSNGFIGQVESPNSPTKYNLTQINRLALLFNCSIRELMPERPFLEDGFGPLPTKS
ncbi:MAG: helix-turn-helix domain-containing protein [Mucilaginibacter sp.]